MTNGELTKNEQVGLIEIFMFKVVGLVDDALEPLSDWVIRENIPIEEAIQVVLEDL